MTEFKIVVRNLDFYETITLVLLYSMILVGVWVIVSLTFYSNGNADIKWLKSGKVVAVMFGVYFLGWWAIEFIWGVLIKTYEPGGWHF